MNLVIFTKKYSYILLLVCLLLSSCGQQTNQEVVNPSLVRVYLNDFLSNGNTPRNFITVDFKPTSDNGFLFFGIGGSGVTTKYGLNTIFCLMKIDATGNLLWEKYYSDTQLTSGFPSNIIETENPDEYVFFWNKVRENGMQANYYRVILKLNNLTEAPTLDNTNIKEISLAAGANVIVQGAMQLPVTGYIVRATPNLAKNGYALMNVANNVKILGATTEQHVTIFNNLLNSATTATYITDLTIKGLSQGNESLRAFDNHYQFFVANNQYFYNAPDGANGFMSLSSIGGTRVPVFRDSLYWVASVYQNKNNANSLLINTENQQNSSLYVPNSDLAPNNFDANKIANISQAVNTPLDPKQRAVLGETSEGLTMMCGSNLQTRNISINFLRGNSVIKTYNLGNTDYNASNIVESEQKNIIAIGGTNNVSQNAKRPFVILIPKTEVLK